MAHTLEKDVGCDVVAVVGCDVDVIGVAAFPKDGLRR